jgi:hypothetical protein
LLRAAQQRTPQLPERSSAPQLHRRGRILFNVKRKKVSSAALPPSIVARTEMSYFLKDTNIRT